MSWNESPPVRSPKGRSACVAVAWTLNGWRRKLRLKIIPFHELSRRWKSYAFIDTTGKAVFVDADLIDNVQLEKKYHRSHGWI